MRRGVDPAFGSLLADDLVERYPQIRRVLDSVLAAESAEKQVVWVHCPRCKGGDSRRPNQSMKSIPVEVEVPRYKLKEVTAFLRLCADFGIAKPQPPPQRVEVLVRQDVPLGELSDEELEALVEGEFSELEQPALTGG